MTEMNDSFLPRLDSAKERLEAVVSHLEAIVAGAGQRAEAEAEAQAMAGDLETLRADHDSLGQAFKALRTDYAALREVADTASARLDATIGRLRSVLDG